MQTTDSINKFVNSLKTKAPVTNLLTKSGLEITIKNPNRIYDIFSRKESTPIALLMSGTSESGKSTMGKYLHKNNRGNRVKILAIIGRLMDNKKITDEYKNENDENDPNLLLTALENNEEDIKLYDKFVDQHLKITKGTYLSVVETFKHKTLVEKMQASKKVRCISIFTDADFEARIKRESIKSGMSIKDTEMAIRKKDQEKSLFGSDSIRSICDIEIMNNGSLEDYFEFIDRLTDLIEEFVPENEKNTFEYS